MSDASDHRALVADALAALGVRRLLLAIHGASFPSDPDEDVGAGSAATRAAGRLLERVHALGFTGVQLGPSGDTSRDNPSPYDGTIFSRAIASIATATYAPGGEFAGLVDARSLARAHGDGGDRGDHRRAHDLTRGLVAAAFAAFAAGARPDLAPRLAAFRAAHAGWLTRDALFPALRQAYGDTSPAAWSAHGADPLDASLWRDDAPARIARRAALARQHARSIDAYAFAQLVAHAEHDRVRARAAALGLALYADLQVGFAESDAWSYAAAFHPDYLMGAPPSRTNRLGQPWNYPVLDPDRMQAGGAARALVRARADKAFAEHDSLRIDHPHGLVCPWVYRRDLDDPAIAVREGARLFESPDLPDHPGLARYAIVAPTQLDRAVPRYADAWVTDLTPEQVDRYALAIDELIAAARHHGRAPDAITCEVLSTMPRPLRDVLARHQLGRWRVLQKANLDDPGDVYRAENAARADWVMLGNHDTPSIWGLIEAWPEATRARWAAHLVAQLALPPAAVAVLADDPGALAAAMFALALACPAENVMLFWADLFGVPDRYNVPGLVAAENWALRLPGDFAALHARRTAAGQALDLPLALALALRARGGAADLVSRLEARAGAAGTRLRAAVGSG